MKVAEELVATLKVENDPILRAEIVKTLGSLSVPNASEGLNLGLTDENSQVRIAACRAWGRRNDPQAVSILAATIADDIDVDVRLAASRALSRSSSDQSLVHLAAMLEDRDPAVQLVTMEILRSRTGADIGDDVNNWLSYLERQPALIAAKNQSSLDSELPLPSHNPSASNARLVSGEKSDATIAAPVYEDVTSGSIFQ